MTTEQRTKDAVSRDEWERRFKARIVARLVGSNELGEGWTEKEAQEAAASEFDGGGFEHLSLSFEDDPEGSADECLSYWSDGA